MVVASGILRIAEEPYVGLRPYDIIDQPRFCGRDRESRYVSALWRSNRLLVLYGPSGVGKTSLIQAGVIPLEQKTADVLPVGRVSHGSVFPTAADRNPFTLALLSSWCPDKSSAELVNLNVTEFLTRRPVRTDRYKDPLPVLGAIDQFEELAIDFPQRQRYLEEFIDQLANAIKQVPSLRLLISIREDALANLIPRETRLAGRFRARFPVLPLSRDAALEAVTGPLARMGRSFAPDVAEKLVDDLLRTEITDPIGETTTVTEDSVDPMRLQVACTTLWRALPDEVTTITEQHLHHHAAIRTVTEFCARMVAAVADEHSIAESALYDWLERAFITRRHLRRPVHEGVSQTAGMSNSIAHALEERSILRVRQRSGSRWYKLQHERLIDPICQANRPQSAEITSESNKAYHYLETPEAALANGDLELAQTYAKEALRTCGDRDVRSRAEAESFLGKIAIQANHLIEAEDHFLRAAEYFQTLQDMAAVGWIFAEIGRLLLARPPYADAVDALQLAVTRLPGDVAVQLEFARALWCSGNLRAAAAVYGRVLTIAPGSAEALAGRGQVLVELKDDKEALKDLDNLPRLQPEDLGRRAEVRVARALALARLGGREEEAVSEADAAVEGALHSGPVLLRAAGVQRAAGEPGRVAELARRALEAQYPRLLPHQREEAYRLRGEAA